MATEIKCRRCTFTLQEGPHQSAEACRGCRAPQDHHAFDPDQGATVPVTLHDLQDLRRRLLLDRRDVENGDLDGVDILGGAIANLEGLIAKAQGLPYVDARGYRFPGVDGSWPEED